MRNRLLSVPFRYPRGPAASLFQESKMNSLLRNARPLLAGAIVVALLGSSGCRWFHGSDYTRSVENRPLEVPPDLNAPSTTNALPLPAASGLGSDRPMVAGFVVPDSPDNTWTRIGAVLPTIEGVAIIGSAQSLGSYDLSYQGQNFQLRIEDTAGQSRVSAISASGHVLRAGPGSILLDLIKSKL
jgi:uncharacterized lipoprotein